MHPVDKFEKLSMNMPLICGHKGVVQDLDFSPFHDNLLASASMDGSLKLWMIPDGGLTEHMTNFDADLKGHTKKVMLMKWHPTASFTIASTGLDGTLKIWDIQSEKNTMSYDNIGQAPWSMQWNNDGSMIGMIAKDKRMHIFDPRSPESAMVTQAHQGGKPQRINWVGNTGKIVTVGTSEYNERQYAIFDTRGDINTPLKI